MEKIAWHGVVSGTRHPLRGIRQPLSSVPSAPEYRKPAGFQFEFVTQRELVFNLNTANEIEVAIPENSLAQSEVAQ